MHKGITTRSDRRLQNSIIGSAGRSISDWSCTVGASIPSQSQAAAVPLEKIPVTLDATRDRS